MNVVSDNPLSYVVKATKRGLPKSERLSKGYEAVRLLNIRHGNGASVVVRARESLVHGEGKQLTIV